MGQESSLWARNHLSGPGVISMVQESSPWARSHLYGIGVISMGQESSLRARNHLYGPGIISMGQESSLWARNHLSGPGVISMVFEQLMKQLSPQTQSESSEGNLDQRSEGDTYHIKVSWTSRLLYSKKSDTTTGDQVNHEAGHISVGDSCRCSSLSKTW